MTVKGYYGKLLDINLTTGEIKKHKSLKKILSILLEDAV